MAPRVGDGDESAVRVGKRDNEQRTLTRAPGVLSDEGVLMRRRQRRGAWAATANGAATGAHPAAQRSRRIVMGAALGHGPPCAATSPGQRGQTEQRGAAGQRVRRGEVVAGRPQHAAAAEVARGGGQEVDVKAPNGKRITKRRGARRAGEMDKRQEASRGDEWRGEETKRETCGLMAEGRPGGEIGAGRCTRSDRSCGGKEQQTTCGRHNGAKDSRGAAGGGGGRSASAAGAAAAPHGD